MPGICSVLLTACCLCFSTSRASALLGPYTYFTRQTGYTGVVTVSKRSESDRTVKSRSGHFRHATKRSILREVVKEGGGVAWRPSEVIRRPPAHLTPNAGGQRTVVTEPGNRHHPVAVVQSHEWGGRVARVHLVATCALTNPLWPTRSDQFDLDWHGGRRISGEGVACAADASSSHRPRLFRLRFWCHPRIGCYCNRSDTGDSCPFNTDYLDRGWYHKLLRLFVCNGCDVG